MLGREKLIGPWAGMPVAWKHDWAFDEAAYRANVDRTCRAGVPGVYTCGTTGEFYAMEMDEFKRVSRATVEECKKHGTPALIGVTSTYTLGAQRRAAYAAELGAAGIQLALPFWMELDNREVLPFFVDVMSACQGLALTIYETTRCRKILTLDQHRAIFEAIPAYGAVKANGGTLGCSVEGCEALSKFVNVWVSEHRWSELGPHGAIGCASAMVYMNPRIILNMSELLKHQRWDELQLWTDRVRRFTLEGLAPLTAKGFQDSAYDHVLGLVAGFLTMHPRSRGPYLSATEEDVVQLREWLRANLPEFLEL